MQLNFQRENSPTPVTETPLILVHGLFGDKDNLNGIRRLLNQHYHTINIDLRNHGHSPWDTQMDYPSMQQDLLDLLDDLQLEKVVLIGHSMGGKVIMQLALTHPERVKALTVLDMSPVAYAEAHHTQVFAGLAAVSSTENLQTRQQADLVLSQQVIDPGVRQFLLKSFDAHKPGYWRFNREVLFTHYSSLMGWHNPQQRTYQGPTLFLRGGQSPYMAEQYFPQIQQQFPNAQGKLLAECGHWLHAEKPQRVASFIMRFLEENQ